MNKFIAEYLENIIPVDFRLEIGEEIHFIGNKPLFSVKLNKNIDKSKLITSTSLALGEAYMKGDIEVDRDLYEVLNLFMGQMSSFSKDESKLKKLMNTSLGKKNQEKEVTSHYDIGNDFYSLWLDETMSYSCAYFKSEEDSLYEAQVNKVDHILDKLFLDEYKENEQRLPDKERMSILDIGCGWGFLLLRACKKYKIKGMGITLSREQYKKFNDEIKKEGLQDYLCVKLMDYRDLKNTDYSFDRVVSVGMIEHVGRGNYEEFMENAEHVLKTGGLFLLHFISAQTEHKGDAFMRKYIFPGGTVPSLREIMNILPEYNFYTLDVESLRRHYNKTLLCWRDNFLKSKERLIEEKGEEFVRMWELYLAACAATFNNGVIDLHQILMSKGINNNIPMLRKV